MLSICFFFFFQAEDGIRDLVRSRGLGDVYKRQVEDLDGPVGPELDVRGLEVPVDDPLLVRRLEGLGDLKLSLIHI